MNVVAVAHRTVFLRRRDELWEQSADEAPQWMAGNVVDAAVSPDGKALWILSRDSLSFCSLAAESDDDPVSFPLPPPLSESIGSLRFLCSNAFSSVVVIGGAEKVFLATASNGAVGHFAHDALQLQQRVVGAAFDAFAPEILVTITDDRTFYIWNITQRRLQYRSGIETGKSFVSPVGRCAERPSDDEWSCLRNSRANGGDRGRPVVQQVCDRVQRRRCAHL